jgi:hypothetical protein
VTATGMFVEVAVDDGGDVAIEDLQALAAVR